MSRYCGLWLTVEPTEKMNNVHWGGDKELGGCVIYETLPLVEFQSHITLHMLVRFSIPHQGKVSYMTHVFSKDNNPPEESRMSLRPGETIGL